MRVVARPLALLTLASLPLGVAGCIRFSDTGTQVDSRVDTSDADTDTDSDTDIPIGALSGHVVIMVFDGARIDETFGDGYSDAEHADAADLFLPVKEHLAPIGAIVKPGYATGITITGPGHCNLITGVRQEFGHFATPDGSGWYRPELPTLYEAFKEQFGGASSDLVVTGNTDHIESLNYSLYPGLGSDKGAIYKLVSEPTDPSGTEPANNDDQVFDAVQSRLQSDHPVLLMANLHSMDRAGHYNPDPDEYGRRVEQMAQPAVDMWDWIQSDASGEMKDNTTLILVADHGRHRWLEESEERLNGEDGPDYRNHGDQCRGCREIPILMVGAGIKKGVTITTPYTQEDVAATVARLLGVALPYTSGVVINEALEGTPDIHDRTGEVFPSTGGGVTAVQTYIGDDDAQSFVAIDGTQVSSADAIHAEAPVVYADASRDVVCWRELTLMLESDEVDWPWFGECRTRVDGGSWADLGLPDKVVSPMWKPSMLADNSGHMLFSFADNTNATTYFNASNPASIRLWRWSQADGWEGTEYTGPDNQSIFPGNPQLAQIDDVTYVAYANSDLAQNGSSNPGRYTRHISVQAVAWGSTQRWSEIWRNFTEECPAGGDCPVVTPTTDTEGNEYGRFEHPAIGAIADTLHVAYVGYGDIGNSVLMVTGEDKGLTWGTPERIDTSGRVLGHVDPVWYGGMFYWARLTTADTVEVCRLAPGDTADCVDTGTERIQGLAVSADGVSAALDAGVGDWVIEDVGF